MEIEGKKESIRDLARQLGMPWHRRILHNYRSMFFIIKQRLGLEFSDITFDNFQGVDLEIDTFLPLFEAG